MISILGCGWYGLALGKVLAKQGLSVKGSTTSTSRVNEISLAGIAPYIVQLTAQELTAADEFFNCGTLVVSIPPKLRSGEINYPAKIQQLVNSIVKHNVKQVIYISSTGVYPDSCTRVNELDIPKPVNEPGKALFAVEELFSKQTSFKTTIIRFGGLVGPGRHPGRFFAGKSNIPNGSAPVNLIHLQDCIQLTQIIIDQQAYGFVFNACAPHHPDKAVFYTRAATHGGLAEPHFINELNDWKIVESVNIPKILDYTFSVSNWDDCFANNCF